MRWWRDQDETTQAATKQLVANGQIEFVDGGWCMADDASPSMDAEIDQNTLGHRYVKDTLGVVPKYAWCSPRSAAAPPCCVSLSAGLARVLLAGVALRKSE